MLYMVKNGTSLEEHTTTQEQLKEMKITTEALAQTLRQKQDALDQNTQEGKEHGEQRKKEIDDLKKLKQELHTERREKEKALMEEGEAVKEAAKERHEAEVTRLNEELKKLHEELAVAKKANTDDEIKLNDKYVQADKGYSEALETYDNEMRDHNKQKDIVTKEYEDQAENLR